MSPASFAYAEFQFFWMREQRAIVELTHIRAEQVDTGAITPPAGVIRATWRAGGRHRAQHGSFRAVVVALTRDNTKLDDTTVVVFVRAECPCFRVNGGL